ncbi:hypothetical protein [Chitinophaga solisilvae]|uniref:hypothetical protein n=1 Tax=Chitinophaga solisilvae TaxID=1233460 RepID=UPI00136F64F9|nr:hypothetical protein [Chitinophaga solisilvae]
MQFLFTARRKFDAQHQEDDSMPWEKYIAWSRLPQLTELVSLDTGLNEVLVEPDRENEDDWKHFTFSGPRDTELFTTLEFVLKRTAKETDFNLLMTVINPEEDCAGIQADAYDFLGYELIDYYYCTSALSNCGGFDETFLPAELNRYGLIDDYQRAYEIRKNLLVNNPEEDHADTDVIAIWRHRTIGR